MKYLTFSGNNIINARLPEGSEILYAPEPVSGLHRRDIPQAVVDAFENPLGMPPLRELVSSSSKVLIAFDDNCQPFPPTSKPDIRQQALEALLPLLYACGVRKENIRLLCAVALHRKMKVHEMAFMVGPQVMREFYPDQLANFDAEDRENIVDLGETEEGEPVEICRDVVDCDLVIYVDSVQIPLNGGHKSVAVGLGTYRSIANHHSPHMTEDSPHVMQPDGSRMHDCIKRISQVVERHAQIIVMEAAMNNATYPFHVSFLGKPQEQCNFIERTLKWATPLTMAVTPEPLRGKILKGVPSAHAPVEINAGAIEDVHAHTLRVMKDQLTISVPRQYSTLVFGLPDISPYAMGARLNPVLVVSDVLGYVFNWFYNKPYIKKGGVAIILNPGMEVFHHEYHVAYQKFYEEVLAATKDPFEMKEVFQDKYAKDAHLIDCYRNRFAHHGYHPFTVWYWATYPLKYLSEVILVGPRDDTVAKRLGVSWAPSLDHALARARERTGEDDVVALTMPPFLYAEVE